MFIREKEKFGPIEVDVYVSSIVFYTILSNDWGCRNYNFYVELRPVIINVLSIIILIIQLLIFFMKFVTVVENLLLQIQVERLSGGCNIVQIGRNEMNIRNFEF